MHGPVPASSSRVTRSLTRYARALEIIPGGTQLVSRRPTRYAYGVSPVYAARAKGARFWDIDGHEYIDWVSGIGAVILGYADDVVIATAALRSVVRHAGSEAVRRHWPGSEDGLTALWRVAGLPGEPSSA